MLFDSQTNWGHEGGITKKCQEGRKSTLFYQPRSKRGDLSWVNLCRVLLRRRVPSKKATLWFPSLSVSAVWCWLRWLLLPLDRKKSGDKNARSLIFCDNSFRRAFDFNSVFHNSHIPRIDSPVEVWENSFVSPPDSRSTWGETRCKCPINAEVVTIAWEHPARNGKNFFNDPSRLSIPLSNHSHLSTEHGSPMLSSHHFTRCSPRLLLSFPINELQNPINLVRREIGGVWQSLSQGSPIIRSWILSGRHYRRVHLPNLDLQTGFGMYSRYSFGVASFPPPNKSTVCSHFSDL